MRAVSARFFFDAERQQCRVYCAGQPGQALVGFDANPEDSGGSRSREEAAAAEGEIESAVCDRLQGCANLFHLLRLADEFQGHVQRFLAHPAWLGRELAHSFHEARNALADFVGDVESDEQAHDLATSCKLQAARDTKTHICQKQADVGHRRFWRYINFLRTISNACWLAYQRMRSRSPGKSRFTTSVFFPSASA